LASTSWASPPAKARSLRKKRLYAKYDAVDFDIPLPVSLISASSEKTFHLHTVIVIWR